jgi:hypothetical protein
MTCEETRARIDDYVDGELPAAEVHEVELHLASCATCRAEEQALRSLLAQAAALPRQATPPRDLWPGIAAEISAPARVFGFPARPFWAGLAAAAALVIAVLAGRGPLPGRAPRPEAPGARGNAATVAASPETSLRDAEADYERAAAALLAVLEAQRERIDPDTLRQVDENLAVIDDAVREVRAALDREPDNPELTRMLAATQRKRVNVLQRVVKLSTSRL